MAGQVKCESQTAKGASIGPSHTQHIRSGVLILLLSGSSTDFLIKVTNQLTSASAFGGDLWIKDFMTSWILLMLSFLACTIPPVFSSETRKGIQSLMTYKLFLKVLTPSILDLLVTGARFWAIAYVSPAVVSILKTSTQLIILTVISTFRKKIHSKRQVLSIMGVIAGNLLVCLSQILRKNDFRGEETSDAPFGLILACVSGILGGVRNTMEEMLLQDEGLTDNALLLIESAVSLFSSVIAGLVILKILDPNLSEYRTMWRTAGVVPTVCVFVLFCYGRELGKLKLTKYSSAVTAKIVSLVFPFGTWALTLLIYFCVTEGEYHPLGGPWNMPWSFLRLAGFILTVISVWFFKYAAKAKVMAHQLLQESYQILPDSLTSLEEDEQEQEGRG